MGDDGQAKTYGPLGMHPAAGTHAPARGPKGVHKTAGAHTQRRGPVGAAVTPKVVGLRLGIKVEDPTQTVSGKTCKQAKYPWILTINGLPQDCADLRWEQFVKGGFTLSFDDDSKRTFLSKDLVAKVNPSSKQYGQWTEDLLPTMTSGPRKIGSQGYDSLSAKPDGLGGIVYEFSDTPGFNKDFGDALDGKVIAGIEWDTEFEHKVWLPPEQQGKYSQSFISVRFSLTGEYTAEGDTCEITLLQPANGFFDLRFR